MVNFSDPFDRIVAGAGMGEWPDRGYETIPPHRIEELQAAVFDHLMAADVDMVTDKEGLLILHAQVDRLFRNDFNRLGILQLGDTIRFSRTGFLMSLEGDGGFCCDLIDDSLYVEGTVVGSAVLPAPLLESIQLNDDNPEPIGADTVTQLAACVELADIVVGSDDIEDDVPEPFDEEAIMTCVPLIYNGMKIQRKL